MNSFYLQLNVLSKDVLLTDWEQFLGFNFNETFIVRYSDENHRQNVFKDSFLKKIESIYKISSFIIFNKNNVISEPGHIDLYRVGADTYKTKMAGLNVVLDRSENNKGQMEWFSIKEGIDKNRIGFTEANTPYSLYSIDELNLECSLSDFSQVTLVKTNVPHRVITGDGPRTCFSIRFEDNNDSWEDVCDKLNNAFSNYPKEYTS